MGPPPGYISSTEQSGRSELKEYNGVRISEVWSEVESVQSKMTVGQIVICELL
jgi:hypothetical protein